MKTKLEVILLSLSIPLMRKCFLVILIFSFLMQASCRKDDLLEPTEIAANENASTLESSTGTTYYVSTTGKDINPGTLTQPWGTFQKAFNTAVAGDIVYFRGGVYYTTVSQNCESHGTSSNPIRFLNYPGEKPIVDGINKTTPSVGITFDQASWIHMKGITVRYHLQIEADDNSAFGFYLYDCSNMRIENCVAHNIGYRGFMIYSPQDSIKIINCDAYNVCDSLSIGDAGNNGDGYIVYDAAPVASDIYDYVLFQGCRAWHCSDDGYDLSSEGLVEIKDCWAIDCGAYPEYDYGNGFKLGLSAEVGWTGLARNMINCVSVYNGGSGVTSNDNNQVAKWMNIYNSTFAYNENLATFYNTSSSDANELKRIMRNNISFNNGSGVLDYGLYTHDHNSWDIPITVTSSDFISIDSTGIRGSRQADGSLPVRSFLKLVSGSDLIDAGVGVGLPFNGVAPELGYSEYVTGSVTPVNPVFVGSVIGNATPSIIEMTYNSTLANIVPAASAFKVQVNSAARTVSSVAISGTKVLLSLASPVVYGNAVTVAYTKPATNPLQNASGGQAISITAQSVKNNAAAGIVIPVYTGSAIANVTPSILQMTYNSPLANIVPATSAFSVMVNSVARTVRSVSISGTNVLLTLASPVVYGNIVTVAYTKPATNPLQTITGGQALTISAQSAINNCISTTNQPPVISIFSPISGSIFRAPATITITANASDINGTITKVEFFNGSIKLGERIAAPYSFVWKNVPRGTYSITASATDNLNSTTKSAPVSVTVKKRTY